VVGGGGGWEDNKEELRKRKPAEWR